VIVIGQPDMFLRSGVTFSGGQAGLHFAGEIVIYGAA